MLLAVYNKHLVEGRNQVLPLKDSAANCEQVRCPQLQAMAE